MCVHIYIYIYPHSQALAALQAKLSDYKISEAALHNEIAVLSEREKEWVARQDEFNRLQEHSERTDVAYQRLQGDFKDLADTHSSRTDQLDQANAARVLAEATHSAQLAGVEAVYTVRMKEAEAKLAGIVDQLHAVEVLSGDSQAENETLALKV
jgi:hypothetical protein